MTASIIFLLFLKTFGDNDYAHRSYFEYFLEPGILYVFNTNSFDWSMLITDIEECIFPQTPCSLHI